MAWPATMDGVPEHIKNVLATEISRSACHACQFSDIMIFDVESWRDWVLEVLEEFL